MATIMPDEIPDIVNGHDATSILHQYIKYMHEQLEFWGSNRQKEINELRARIIALEEQEEE